MPPDKDDQLTSLVQRFGGFDNEASTEYAMHVFSYLKAHRAGFLNSLGAAMKILEVLAERSTDHHVLVCENLKALLDDLQRAQN